MSKYHRVDSEAGDKAEIKRSSKVRYRINWKRFAVFILLVVLVLFLCIKGITGCVNRDKPDDGSVKKDNVADPSTVELKGDEPPTGEDTSIRGIPELKDVLTYDDGDLLVLVNKYHGVTRDYEPKDMVEVDLSMAAWDGIMIKKEAYDAFTELFRDAEAQGFTLAVCSGYRSYEYQQELFENALATQSEEEAHMFSAYPGRSEHHTGLAIDITSESMDWALSQDFASYPEGQWLDEHCQDYGFILRYQKGKEDITGYQYEPWHFRYVGKEVAKDIMSRGITFEEYLGEN